MNKKDIKNKASLSWTEDDYKKTSEEPPKCLEFGLTEGESMDSEAVEDWIREEVQCLSVFKEDYPEKFEEQYGFYLLDLEYLYSLGKIDREDYLRLCKEELFNFE